MLARKSRFFKFAHPASRRPIAPFLRAEAVGRLGEHAVGFGKEFETRVRTLFRQGFIDKDIASLLGVNLGTVNQRTRQWRKRKSKGPRSVRGRRLRSVEKRGPDSGLPR